MAAFLINFWHSKPGCRRPHKFPSNLDIAKQNKPMVVIKNKKFMCRYILTTVKGKLQYRRIVPFLERLRFKT